jgi:hypothetical protein
LGPKAKFYSQVVGFTNMQQAGALLARTVDNTAPIFGCRLLNGTVTGSRAKLHFSFSQVAIEEQHQDFFGAPTQPISVVIRGHQSRGFRDIIE